MTGSPDRGRELSEAEVREAIASARTLSKDPARLLLLLERMLTTIDLHGRRVQGLRDSMEALMESRKPSGVIEDVLEELRKLGPEKREEVLGFHVTERIALAEKAEADALRAKTAARSETNRARFALAKVANDPEIPANVRARVQEVLSSLPAGAGLEARVSREEASARTLPDAFLPPTVAPVARSGSRPAGHGGPDVPEAGTHEAARVKAPGRVEASESEDPDDLASVFS
jgi:hypothetical protein